MVKDYLPFSFQPAARIPNNPDDIDLGRKEQVEAFES